MIAAIPQQFAAMPGAIAQELERYRRVVVVLLDAFGWRFVERHERHPLLARLAREGSLAPMATQFPSTTTAHVTTMHTGLPVDAHGLYEWRIWEPALRRVVTPLIFSWGGDHQPDTMDGSGLPARDLLPEGPSFYQRLAARGVTSTVFSPARFSPSTYDGAAIRGARLMPYDELADGARALAAALAAEPDRLYAYLYYDGIDATGHRQGPTSAAFDAVALAALDALDAAFFGPDAPALDDTLLVLTADHGQVDVSPERVDDLDVLVPDLEARMDRDARGLPVPPAGSARDVFLHVAADRVDETVADLAAALEDRGTAHRVADLLAEGAFGAAPGPRLLSRLGSVCVLPAPDRMAWLAAHRDVERVFLGHHGGRTPQEATTFVGAVPLGSG